MTRILLVLICAYALLAAGCEAGPKATAAPPDIAGIWGGQFVKSLSEDAPMLPEARAVFEATRPADDPIAKCMPPGIPRLMNMAFPFQVIQTPDIVYFLMEYGQHVRRIYIDGQHPADLNPSWLGHSVGHWEGRTLVVDTIDMYDLSWLDIDGHRHSDALRVTERYTLSDDGESLKQEVTIDDPNTYSRPWQTVASVHKRQHGRTIQEFLCVLL